MKKQPSPRFRVSPKIPRRSSLLRSMSERDVPWSPLQTGGSESTSDSTTHDGTHGKATSSSTSKLAAVESPTATYATAAEWREFWQETLDSARPSSGSRVASLAGLERHASPSSLSEDTSSDAPVEEPDEDDDDELDDDDGSGSDDSDTDAAAPRSTTSLGATAAAAALGHSAEDTTTVSSASTESSSTESSSMSSSSSATRNSSGSIDSSAAAVATDGAAAHNDDHDHDHQRESSTSADSLATAVESSVTATGEATRDTNDVNDTAAPVEGSSTKSRRREKRTGTSSSSSSSSSRKSSRRKSSSSSSSSSSKKSRRMRGLTREDERSTSKLLDDWEMQEAQITGDQPAAAIEEKLLRRRHDADPDQATSIADTKKPVDRETALADIAVMTTKHRELVLRHSEEVLRKSRRDELLAELDTLHHHQREVEQERAAAAAEQEEHRASLHAAALDAATALANEPSPSSPSSSSSSPGGIYKPRSATMLSVRSDCEREQITAPKTPPVQQRRAKVALPRHAVSALDPPSSGEISRSSSQPPEESSVSSPHLGLKGSSGDESTPSQLTVSHDSGEEKVVRRITSPRRKGLLRHSATVAISRISSQPIGTAATAAAAANATDLSFHAAGLLVSPRGSSSSDFSASLNKSTDDSDGTNSRRKHHFRTMAEFMRYLYSISALREQVSKQSWNMGCADYFDAPDGPDNLLVEQSANEVIVRGLSKFKVVQWLSCKSLAAQHGIDNELFVSIVLLTYRRYFTPFELLEMLILRYNAQPPSTIVTAQALSEWFSLTLKPIRNCIASVLVQWIDKWFKHDMNEPVFLDTMLNFIEVCMVSTEETANRKRVKRALANHMFPETVRRSSVFLGDKRVPKPLQPKTLSSKKLSASKMHPTEVARQLSLLTSEQFQKISPNEFLNLGWLKPNKLEVAPNIVELISMFNTLGTWVATEIMAEPEVARRAKVLNRFILIAEECRAINNFDSLMGIMAGLQSAPVWRLHNTWALLPDKTWNIWDILKEFIASEGNYQRYREVLRDAVPPIIPYLGIHLTDLVFLDEGNPDLLPDTNLLNFWKMRLTAGVIFSLESMKEAPYLFVPLPAIQAYLCYPPKADWDELLSRSQQYEARRG